MKPITDKQVMFLRGEYIGHFTQLEISIEHYIVMFFMNNSPIDIEDKEALLQQDTYNAQLSIFLSTEFFRKEGISVNQKLEWAIFITKLTNILLYNNHKEFFVMIKDLIRYRNMLAHGITHTEGLKKGLRELKNIPNNPLDQNNKYWKITDKFYEVKKDTHRNMIKQIRFAQKIFDMLLDDYNVNKHPNTIKTTPKNRKSIIRELQTNKYYIDKNVGIFELNLPH